MTFRLPVMRRFLANTALLLISLSVALVAAEYLTRMALDGITTTSAGATMFDLRWKNAVKQRELNRHGFREREYEDTHLEKVFRIAVIGDSLTFGQGIAREERYTNLVEASLNRTAAANRFEVLQFALPGLDANMYLKIYDGFVAGANPDFVLLQWYVNDFELDKSERPFVSRLIADSRIHYYWLRRSALYFLVHEVAVRAYEAIMGIPSYGRYLAGQLGNPNGVKWRQGENYLRGLIERVTGCGHRFGIVLFPELSATLSSNYELAFLHDRVLQICNDYGIRCLDLRGIMAAYEDPTRLWVNPFDGHYGPQANKMVAKAILEFFGPEWQRTDVDRQKTSPCQAGAT